MAATPQNVEMEAAKFLHKLIQESTDEPTKLATKLHLILQHMRSSGKENSMPYQVTSRAMETVINRHGLDIEALMASPQPLTSGTQAGDSSLSQVAGISLQAAVENYYKRSLTTEETTKVATFSSKPLHGPGSAGHDIYQGSAHQLNSIKSHGVDAGFSGSYESAEPGNPISMQFSSSYDNQSAATLMHIGPAGKALEQEGGVSNVMANASKTVQGGISNNVAEMGMFRAEASRDGGKSPVLQASSVGPVMPFKEHHLKQFRAQCLVFLAFRNNLTPKKLHLDIALGDFFLKEALIGTGKRSKLLLGPRLLYSYGRLHYRRLLVS